MSGSRGALEPRAAVFGGLLKRFRRAAGLTQEELAARAGYSAVYVSMLERGRRLPLPATAGLLAAALDLAAHDRELLLTAARGQSDLSNHTSVWSASPQPLIGRERELAAIEAHLVGAGPPVLALAGEPGIGKTRLLQEAAERGAAYGWRALYAGCQRRGGQEPYAPLLGAIEQHVRDTREREPARLRAALEGCAWLTRLLPELAEAGLEPLPAWTVAPEQERRLVTGAVSRFLSNVAGPSGTVLALDDLQWAGRDALDLLTALVRSTPRAPLRVIVAYRDTEVRMGDPLADMLANLAHAGLVTHLTPAPLTGLDAARLLDRLVQDVAAVQPALRAQVLRRAEGVPFFLVSCAQALRAGQGGGEGGANEGGGEGGANEGGGEGGARAMVPWDVAQSVRQRVAALPEEARALLDSAAVVGRRASRALLMTLAGCPEEEALAALETACRARLLEEDAEAYLFVHDVIREVVEANLGAGRRAALHRRVATELEYKWAALGMREEPLEILAYHYVRGGVEDKAARYLEQAGDHARTQTAHATAEAYYREAAALLDGLGRARDGARVREQAGAVLTAAARYDAALASLEEAAATYRRVGDLEGLGRTVAGMGYAHILTATPEEGIGRLQPLLEPLEAGEALHGLAALYTALAHLYFASGRYIEQLVAAGRAAELARAVGDDGILAAAEGRRGVALFALGRLDEALPVLEEAIRVADVTGDLATLCRALINVATIHFYRGDLARSRPYGERALEVAERHGGQAEIVRTTTNHGEFSLYTGDWRRASLDFERALALSRAIGSPVAAVYPLLDLGHLRLAEGAWEEAARHVEEALAMAEQGKDLQALRWGHGLLAERDLLEGRPDRARLRLGPFLDRPGLEELDVDVLLPLMAWAHLDLGELDVATEMAARGLTRARAEGNRVALVDALRVQAIVSIRQRQWGEAERFLGEGLARARDMPYPYAEGRLLYVNGLLHIERGELEPAWEQLEAALALFRRLGARGEIARTEEAIGRGQAAWTGRPDLRVTDAQWAAVETLLPPVAATGRRRADDRRTLEAILYVRRTGCAWADLPPDLGDDATAHRRLAEWRAAGLWDRIDGVLREIAVDGRGAATGVGAATHGAVEL